MRSTFTHLSIVFMLLLPANAASQCELEPKISYARVHATQLQTLIVGFDVNTNWSGAHSSKLSAVLDPANWTIVSPTLLEKAKATADPVAKAALFAQAMPDMRHPVRPSADRAVLIDVNAPFLAGEKYTINVTHAGRIISTPCVGSAIEIKNLPKVVDTGAAAPSDPPKTVIAAVKKREDADIYIEGLAEGSSGEDVGFTVDAAISKNFRFKKDDPDNTWKPFFEIKASTKEGADPNSLRFGIGIENAKALSTKPLGVTDLFFSETAKIEADRNFRSVNLIGDVRTHIVSKYLAGARFDVVPFFGIEFGKNLNSPVNEIEGNGIARPLLGANLYYNIYTWDSEAYEFSKALTFETLYVRRWPLTREIAIDDNDAGDPIGIHIGKRPRDYMKSSLTYDFAKNFGFKLNYEYGSLPPLFKLVDHKFSVGLVFKGIFKKQ